MALDLEDELRQAYRTPATENQRGPMTMVYVRAAEEYLIAHLHFGNYESRPE